MTIRRGSRYENAIPFLSETGEPVFPGLRPRPIGPADGVVEHVVQAGDRLDGLASYYYGDDRLWWRIADANPQVAEDLIYDVEARERPLRAGATILIPRRREA